jgi:hypothetical protein
VVVYSGDARTENEGMRTAQTTNHRTAVLSRVIRPERDDLSPDAARSILKLAFEQADLDRMHELAVKGQKGELSREEQAEIAEYRQVGLLLDLLKSKAHLSLKKCGPSGE